MFHPEGLEISPIKRGDLNHEKLEVGCNQNLSERNCGSPDLCPFFSWHSDPLILQNLLASREAMAAVAVICGRNNGLTQRPKG